MLIQSFPGTVWGKDLNVSLKNDVAAITPEMEIIDSEQGKIGSPIIPKGLSLKVTPELIRKAGFIHAVENSIGTIIKHYEDVKDNIAAGEISYIDIGSQDGVEVGDRFTVLSVVREIRHPVETEEKISYLPEMSHKAGFKRERIFIHRGTPQGPLVKNVGVVEVLELTGEVSKVKVIESFDVIKVGDLLVPFQEMPAPEMPANNRTHKNIEGYIISNQRDGDLTGMGQFVYIDKGSADDVAPGDWFEAYVIPQKEIRKWYELNTTKTPLVPEVIGELQVLSTTENTATLVVMKSYGEFWFQGQHVRYKR
ncbi:MAG: hypothetical protein VX667_01340 [Nitrospinota bacterium]|nr:hypothetical protein [Nitrospinota bacterium]